MATIEVKQLVRSVAQLVKSLNPRNRDIVARRFGLKNGVRETLESIGKSYGITRERVRQIEEFALAQLAKAAPASRDLTRAIEGARDLIVREGGVMRERSLFAAVSGSEKDSAANAALAFALSLDKGLVRSSDSDRFQAFWAVDARTADSFREQASGVIGALSDRNTVMSREELVQTASAKGVANLNALMAVSKELGQNIFGELGLASWSQIHPKGVRDKAFLVIKKAGKPRHFSEIAKLINQAKFDTKKTNVQTVHNELIKDDRFVLVGRGMYALAEWGYKSGTVKDVLTDILKTHGKPLPRADLIARVGKVRLVKENTILLNLQDSSTFVRDTNGHYTLRRR
ncbi:MAG TPA: sigma factor-like helix-turn-helix DNA-binding protein [Candidatus Paceibacterota bacterium]|nr:sigma factor-like helix-turn-helix DNA-binding protein [Candidatus Paceibacterota bacterium]